MEGVHVSNSTVYDKNHGILRFFNEGYSKVTLLKCCRLPGYEVSSDVKRKRNSAGHDTKLSSSLSRTRSALFELAACNPWEYFVTLTLAPVNGDRQDIKAFQRKLSNWIKNTNYRRNCSIKYLLIPEPHKDGSWHMHGLFMDIPEAMLRPFSTEEHLPYRLLDMLQSGRLVYDWPAYRDKFGFVTCERIRDPIACARYITKYITKELGESALRLNQKLYFCSVGLNRSLVLCRGHIGERFEPDFSNEYVAIKAYSDPEEALQLFEACDAEVGFEDVTGVSWSAPWRVEVRDGKWIICD